MRKYFISVALVFGMTTFSHAATSILFNWTNTANAGVPACTVTVTTSCMTAFTLTDTTTGTVVSSTIPFTILTYTYTPASGIPFGYNHSFSLTVSGKDASGNAVSSLPATTSVISNILNAPTGFSAVIQ